MTWETATIVGSLGVSFYLLYLQNQFTREHAHLKIGLITLSLFSVVLTLASIAQLITFSAPTATENINLANRYYTVGVWISIGFLAYWLIYIVGNWLGYWKKI